MHSKVCVHRSLTAALQGMKEWAESSVHGLSYGYTCVCAVSVGVVSVGVVSVGVVVLHGDVKPISTMFCTVVCVCVRACACACMFWE